MSAVRTAIVCLVIGVAITYVSAWLIEFASVRGYLPGRERDAEMDPTQWPYQRVNSTLPKRWNRMSWRCQRIEQGEWEAPGAVNSTFEVLTQERGARAGLGAGAVNPTFEVLLQGFPFLGLRSTSVSDAETSWLIQETGAVTVPATESELAVLCLLPAWPGFALNTLFYAGIAYGLWQIPLAIRRRRRRRANRCVKCGYDLAGLAAGAPCPECGRPAVHSGTVHSSHQQPPASLP